MRRAMSMDLASNSEEAGGEASSIADEMATNASRAKNEEKEKPIVSVLLMIICIRLLLPRRASAAVVAGDLGRHRPLVLGIDALSLLQQRPESNQIDFSGSDPFFYFQFLQNRTNLCFWIEFIFMDRLEFGHFGNRIDFRCLEKF